MKVHAFTTYLRCFEPDAELAVVIVDLAQRRHYSVDNIMFSLDSPTMLLEIKDPAPLDEIDAEPEEGAGR